MLWRIIKYQKRWFNLTESIRIITPDLRGVIYVPREELIEFEPKKIFKEALSDRNELDLIERKRDLKRWKQSLGYYSLHPDKFRFGLRDLK